MPANEISMVRIGLAIQMFLLCLILALAPLPRAAVSDWAWTALAIVVGLMLIVQGASAMGAGSGSILGFQRLLWLAVPVLLVCIWIVMQTTGWGTLERWRNPLADMLPAQFGIPLRSAVVLDGDRGWTMLAKALTYAGTFAIAAHLAVSARRGKLITTVIVLSAVIYTGGAMAWEALKHTSLWPGQTGAFHGLTGPFFNRNHYASYTGLAGLIALARLFPDRSAPPRGRGAEAVKWARLLKSLAGAGGLNFSAFVLLSFGIAMSRSRAGFFCFMLASIFLVAIQASGRIRWFAFAGLVLAALGSIAMPGGSDLLERFTLLTGNYEGGRKALAAMALDGIALRPLEGWGAGSFQYLYFMFQPADLSGIYTEVHNTYLEIAFELGVPALCLLLVTGGAIFYRCLSGVRDRTQNRELPAAAAACMVLICVHSLFDFAVQLPAVAVVFAAVLGVGWTQSWSARR
jgi:O-antigen ligase